MRLSFQATAAIAGAHRSRRIERLACWSLPLLLVLVSGACHKKNTLGLDVDLYLYPEAAGPDDLLLQTAIRKQLDESAVTQNSLIHVRVVDKIVFLTGSVDTQLEKDEAERVARSTTVTVNGALLKASEVRDDIEVGS